MASFLIACVTAGVLLGRKTKAWAEAYNPDRGYMLLAWGDTPLYDHIRMCRWTGYGF